MKKFLATVLSVLSVVATAPSVRAESEIESFEQLMQQEAQVVTASKKAEKIEDAPGVVTVITAENIRRFGARNLRDVLDRAPSVYTLGSYLVPSNLVAIRGDQEQHMDTHVLWLVDGRPMRDPVFGGVNYTWIQSYPLEMIERIEFIRGPGSVLYGSNAYTGVINIITKKVDKRELAVTAGGGSYDTGYGKASAALPYKDGGALGAFRYLRSGGWRAQAVDELGLNGAMRMKEEDTSLALNTRYKDLSMIGYYGKTHNVDLGVLPRWYNTPIEQTHGLLDLGYKHALVEGWIASANLTYNYNDQTVVDPKPNGKSNQLGNSLLTELMIQGSPLEDLGFLMGGTLHKIWASIPPYTSQDVPKPAKTWWTFYSQADYRLNRFLKALAGVQYNKDQAGATATSPRAGLIATINPNWGVKLLYGEAFRSPYPIETDFQAVPLHGNPRLKPETIRTVDVQAFHRSQKIQSALTYFHSFQRDRITRVACTTANCTNFVPGVTFTYDNAGSLTSNGVEYEITVYPTPSLSLVGSYAYQVNRNQNHVYDVTFMPRNMVKTGVSYAAERGVTTGIFNSYFSARGDVGVVTPTVAKANKPSRPFNWLTANVNADLHKLLRRDFLSGVTASASIVNVLNEQVYDPEFNRRNVNTLPARPGRSYYSEVSIRF